MKKINRLNTLQLCLAQTR